MRVFAFLGSNDVPSTYILSGICKGLGFSTVALLLQSDESVDCGNKRYMGY